jgi:hypothetical protein
VIQISGTYLGRASGVPERLAAIYRMLDSEMLDMFIIVPAKRPQGRTPEYSIHPRTLT